MEDIPYDDQPADDQPSDEQRGEGEELQRIRHKSVSARVPESVSRGVFSTGSIVITGPNEFIVDFVQCLGRPHQVVSRVVMAPKVVSQFITALQKNLENYRQRFGELPELPQAVQDAQKSAPKPAIQEVYDDLKLPDDLLAGTYANAVMIAHTPTEFRFDFLASFFPRSAVSSRVFLGAAQVTKLLESLQRSLGEFQQRQQGGQNPPPPPPPDDRGDDELMY
jgi:hypothetical protein